MSGGFNMDDYVPVNERIEAFYAKHPEGSLQAEIVERTEDRVTVKAYAYRTPDDTRPGTGLSSERIPGLTSFTKGSELENAETSAWGRAIAALGFEVKRGIASREEMRRNEQPDGGERVTRTHGRRTESRQPATTRRPVTKGEALERLAWTMRAHSLTFAHVDRLAKEHGLERGTATAAEILRLVALIEPPDASVPTAPTGTGRPGGSVPAAPIHTASTDGTPEHPGGSSVPSTPTDPPSASPPAAGSGPSLEDVLEVTGGELIPPRPGTEPYKAMTPTERANAKAYWQREDAKPIQETLAEALGAPEHD